jgi:hypothetical protein
MSATSINLQSRELAIESFPTELTTENSGIESGIECSRQIIGQTAASSQRCWTLPDHAIIFAAGLRKGLTGEQHDAAT